MPVISRFCGIIIKMHFKEREHNPPHIHAVYGEYNGIFSLVDGEMFEGDIPFKEQRIVERFIEHNREKLIHMWETQEFEVLPPVV